MNHKDLVKLTIPQLRAICKEKKIVGYGKIPKSGVIQKILDHDANLARSLTAHNLATASNPLTACHSATAHNTVPTGKPSAVPQALSGPGISGLPSKTIPSIQTSTTRQNPSRARSPTPKSVPPKGLETRSAPISILNLTSTPSARPSVAPVNASVSATTNSSVNQLKRKIDFSLEQPLANKKQKEDLSARVQPSAQAQFKIPAVPKPLAYECAASRLGQTRTSLINTYERVNATGGSMSRLGQPGAMNDGNISMNHNNNKDARPSSQARISQKIADVAPNIADTILRKRFVPLVTKNLAAPSQRQLRESAATLADHAQQHVSTQTNPQKYALVGPLLHHLDFPVINVPKLYPITPSPSLAQRKRVPTLALILSGISDSELRVCAQVSRLFRYAAYISASDRLSRGFPGKRLEIVLRAYSVKMINMWPYLAHREIEREVRKGGYEGSFLGRALGSRLIVDRLWASPDHEMQITVAVRFLLTRLFFVISIGHDPRSMHDSTIIGAQEVVPDEIWCISSRSSRGIEKFHVLLLTCEVVGRSSPALASSESPQPTESDPPLRADWTAYIHSRLSPSHEPPAPSSRDYHQAPASLIERLKWTNHEEYERGISRLWLARIDKEGEMGLVKRTVAQRYVMACVVGNSVSGRWMSSNDMALDFNGNGASSSYVDPLAHSKQRCPKVHLFLPAHHHVESVHFTTSAGQLLHPALAVVQTPGREYYILRDNGMQVGCEEEGVAEVWMGILGCTNSGVDTSWLV